RRGSLPLHALAGENHLLPSARRTRHPRRFARLPGLHGAAQLRLDDRQSDRLRRQPRAGDGAHAHRALGDGGRGHPDQHPAAPRAHERYALHARRRVDPLPRAEAGAGADQEEVMPWHALTLRVDGTAAEAFSDALLEAGAQSVAMEPEGALVAILSLEQDAHALVEAAAQAAGVPAPRFATARLEDEDW